MKNMKLFTRLLLILSAITMAGCSALPSATTIPTRVKAVTATVAIRRPAATATFPPLTTAEDLPAAVASPTPDLRLPPERWQEWPVVPTASGRALDIYRRGLALGNDPKAFSKIGDCQSIREVLMGIFDLGRYKLTEDELPLQETIDQFIGSFNRDGMAVQGGFNAASVLSPLWANPDTCRPGENPLACEVRAHRPSFALISLEVWWNGRTPERYEQYMRRIIEYLLSKGVVPILSTKADNVEGDNSINLTNAKLAYEYDLPLWNWWRAAQDLPNNGLDPTRPDGFHISQESWGPRAFTALKSLDSVWRGVRDQSASVPTTPAPNPLSTAEIAAVTAPPVITPGPTETFVAPTPGPTPIGGSGTVVFGVEKRAGEQTSYEGVYLLDLQTGAKTQIAGSGYNFQSVSPDGRRLLMNNGSDLYVANRDGSNPLKISDSFFAPARQGALWLPDGQSLAFIADKDGQRFVVNYPLDGTGWKRLTGAADSPIELYPSAENGQVFWGKGSCTAAGDCAPDGAAVSTLAGLTRYLPGVIHPSLSPSAPSLAYSVPKNEDQSMLVLGSADSTTTREAPLPGDNVLDYSWSPDGKRLSVLLLNRSGYSGKWESINHFLFTPANYLTKALPKASGLNARSLWSPDGLDLLVTGTDTTPDGYRVNMRVLNPQTNNSVNLTAPLDLSGPDPLLITNLSWLPGKN
jgi:hypothetical protein